MSTSASVPAEPAASSAPALVLPTTVRPLLLVMLSLHARRSSAYSAFHSGFRSFLAARDQYERDEAEEAERRRKESTVMVQQVQQAKTGVVQAITKAAGAASSSSSSSSSSSVAAQDVRTLQQIASANDAEKLKLAQAKPNPERVFQQLCADTMQAFQGVSTEVRAIIAQLASLGSSSAAADGPAWAQALTRLQQLEKQKLELTIHQQMLHNQQYVLAHPRAHGQLQEHQHHVHSVTDAQGRVRQHPKHHHGHAHGGTCLSAVGEHGDAEEVDPEDAQELADNDQPFTRHLSALLSDTAFRTDAPHFLFPPSGRAPEKVDTTPTNTDAASPAGRSSTPKSTLAPAISAAQIEAYLGETSALREQEARVVERINEILEEVRMETMEEAAAAEEEEDQEDEAKEETKRA